MAVTDYSTAPADNTSISGIPVTDATSIDSVDNIIRQLMADMRALYDGTTLSAPQTVSAVLTYTVGPIFNANIFADFAGEFEIGYNGVTGLVRAPGTSNISIDAVGSTVNIKSKGDVSALFDQNGVQLYRFGNLKLETTAAGVDVTGDMQADTATVAGEITAQGTTANAKIFARAGGELEIQAGSDTALSQTSAVINASTDPLNGDNVLVTRGKGDSRYTQIGAEGGPVGSMVFALYTGGGTVTKNTLVSGADLSPSSVSATASSNSGTLSGSWKCLGYLTGSAKSTFFQRIV